MPREFARSERVAQTINRQLAMILRNQVKDPRVSSLTVTDVEVTKDLRQAKIYVTSMVDDSIDIEDVMAVSAKTGQGVDALLDQIVERIPAPAGDPESPVQAMVFDSVYAWFGSIPQASLVQRD